MKRQDAEHDLYIIVNIHLDPSNESPEQATPMGNDGTPSKPRGGSSIPSLQPLYHSSGYGWVAIKHVFQAAGVFRLKIRAQNAAFCKCQDKVHFLARPGHGPLDDVLLLL
jgi:hypothetical protein